DAAIQNIRLAVLSAANSGISDAVGAKIVNDFDELQDARNARLGINISLIDPSKWYLLLSFTFLTTITIALLHMDRPVAGRTAATIFSITALAGLWILAIHVDPLSGIRDDYLSYGLPSASAKGQRSGQTTPTRQTTAGGSVPPVALNGDSRYSRFISSQPGSRP